MGKQYVVTVFEVDTANDTEVTLVELRAPAEMLRTFAPAAVGAALGAESVQVGEPPRMAMDGPVAAPDSEPKERRRRRTKAEMEAARAVEQEPKPEIEVTTTRISSGETVVERAEPAAYNPFS